MFERHFLKLNVAVLSYRWRSELQFFLLEQACPNINKEYTDEFMDFVGGIVPNFKTI